MFIIYSWLCKSIQTFHSYCASVDYCYMIKITLWICCTFSVSRAVCLWVFGRRHAVQCLHPVDSMR
jgi:hypothetical protein